MLSSSEIGIEMITINFSANGTTLNPAIVGVQDSRDSKVIAGIISGAIVTAIVMTCILSALCKMRYKKMHFERKNSAVTVQEWLNSGMESSTGDGSMERPIVLTQAQPFRSPLTHCSRGHITDASVASESLVLVPLNPPPSLADISPLLSMLELDNPPPTFVDYSSINTSLADEHNQKCCASSQYMHGTIGKLDKSSNIESGYFGGPPPTPRYCPSVTTLGSDQVFYSKIRPKYCEDCDNHGNNEVEDVPNVFKGNNGAPPITSSLKNDPLQRYSLPFSSANTQPLDFVESEFPYSLFPSRTLVLSQIVNSSFEDNLSLSSLASVQASNECLNQMLPSLASSRSKSNDQISNTGSACDLIDSYANSDIETNIPAPPGSPGSICSSDNSANDDGDEVYSFMMNSNIVNNISDVKL